MKIFSVLDQHIKSAMLQKEEAKLRALRALKSALLLAKTEGPAGQELSDESELKVLQKQIKQRKDSIEIYKGQGRADLSKIEEEELEVMESFLPKQLNAEELQAKIQSLAAELGIENAKDMGKLIAAANKALAGQSDGKSIAEMVKKVLNP